MKKKISFNYLKSLVKESLVKESGVSVDDMPERLYKALTKTYHATIHDPGHRCPEIFVSFPAEFSRSGDRLTNTVLKDLKMLLNRCGWVYIDSEEPWKGLPTISIAPRGMRDTTPDDLDRAILAQRAKDTADATRYALMGRDSVDESTKVTLTLKQLKELLH